MDDELVDIINEEEKVLYQTTKTAAHKKGLLHKTVIAELRCSDGRWILVKQSADRQDAGQFVFPVGGHVSSGETDPAALKREALEETGLQEIEAHFIGKKVFKRTIQGRIENHLFSVYEIEADSIPEQGVEYIEFRYFTKEDLKHMIKNNPKYFGDAFYFIVKNFHKELLN